MDLLQVARELAILIARNELGRLSFALFEGVGIATGPPIPPMHLPFSTIEFISGHLGPKSLRAGWGSDSLF